MVIEFCTVFAPFIKVTRHVTGIESREIKLSTTCLWLKSFGMNLDSFQVT